MRPVSSGMRHRSLLLGKNQNNLKATIAVVFFELSNLVCLVILLFFGGEELFASIGFCLTGFEPENVITASGFFGSRVPTRSGTFFHTFAIGSSIEN